MTGPYIGVMDQPVHFHDPELLSSGQWLTRQPFSLHKASVEWWVVCTGRKALQPATILCPWHPHVDSTNSPHPTLCWTLGSQTPLLWPSVPCKLSSQLPLCCSVPTHNLPLHFLWSCYLCGSEAANRSQGTFTYIRNQLSPSADHPALISLHQGCAGWPKCESFTTHLLYIIASLWSCCLPLAVPDWPWTECLLYHIDVYFWMCLDCHPVTLELP